MLLLYPRLLCAHVCEGLRNNRHWNIFHPIDKFQHQNDAPHTKGNIFLIVVTSIPVSRPF